jgi:hypothetical protein
VVAAARAAQAEQPAPASEPALAGDLEALAGTGPGAERP